MWFKHRAWVPAAWILAAVNVVSVWFAAVPAEPWHATVHGVLAVGFALGAQRLRMRGQLAMGQDLQEALDENERLRQTLEGVQPRMLELEERVDFTERLLATQREAATRDAPPR